MSYVLEDSRKSNVDIAAFSGEKISKILLLTDYENMHDFSDHRDSTVFPCETQECSSEL